MFQYLNLKNKKIFNYIILGTRLAFIYVVLEWKFDFLNTFLVRYSEEIDATNSTSPSTSSSTIRNGVTSPHLLALAR